MLHTPLPRAHHVSQCDLQAEAEAAASPPYVMPEFAGRSELPWFMTEVPTDYEFWLEQVRGCRWWCSTR